MDKLNITPVQMSKVKGFLELVEIRTKVASVFPFMIGTLYAITRYRTFNFTNAILMFFSLLMIDMATTSANNYMDYKKAVLKEGYHYQVHNPIAKAILAPEHARQIIIALVTAGAVLGGILAVQTDLIVLLVGMLSFMVGLLYSFGPVPISRTPLGEILSGLFMGLVIVSLSVYIQIIPHGIVQYGINQDQLYLAFKWHEILNIFLVGLPMTFLISNIMLANNICDMEEDKANRRMTLPILVGEASATKFYLWAIYGAYATIALAIMVGALPPILVTSLASFPLVRQQAWKFVEHPVKSETFVYAVKSFVTFSLIYVLGFLLYSVQLIL